MAAIKKYISSRRVDCLLIQHTKIALRRFCEVDSDLVGREGDPREREIVTDLTDMKLWRCGCFPPVSAARALTESAPDVALFVGNPVKKKAFIKMKSWSRDHYFSRAVVRILLRICSEDRIGGMHWPPRTHTRTNHSLLHAHSFLQLSRGLVDDARKLEKPISRFEL